MRLNKNFFHRYRILLIFIILCFSFILLTHIDIGRNEVLYSEESDQKCDSETTLKKGLEYRGNYIVFKNYIPANREFKSNESITLTAPGDFRFLDNILPLVDRWRGPISVALYAPGDDFFATIKSIAYLRMCTTSMVKEFVTFHIFFDVNHMPKVGNISLDEIYEDQFDCTRRSPYETMIDNETYKERLELFYPINVARNIAKLNAQTHFVFPSDIELYPTRHFIPKFLDFVEENPQYFDEQSRNVFVLPIFEILAERNIPETKTALQIMHKNHSAFGFHAKVCSKCHNMPKQQEWILTNETRGLNIFTSTKRQGKQVIWEPFFVCTQEEPLWDERLNWEGQGNKMCQAFHLCMLDYNFQVFDNAFLIHKPGVKKKKVQNVKYKDQQKINNEILRKIQQELRDIYGSSKGNTTHCMVHYLPKVDNVTKVDNVSKVDNVL